MSRFFSIKSSAYFVNSSYLISTSGINPLISADFNFGSFKTSLTFVFSIIYGLTVSNISSLYTLFRSTASTVTPSLFSMFSCATISTAADSIPPLLTPVANIIGIFEDIAISAAENGTFSFRSPVNTLITPSIRTIS